jgi:beta-glucanase (GH16 family)
VYWIKAKAPSGIFSIHNLGESAITKAKSGGTISVNDLKDGEYLSAFVMANKAGYLDAISNVATAEKKPVDPNGTDPNDPDPIDPNDPPTPLYTHPDLLWSDEFNGDSLDLTKWNYDYGDGGHYGNGGWGNGEQQFYTPDNVSVKDGKLVIEGKRVKTDEERAKYNGMDFSSGKILTGGTLNLDGTTHPPKFTVQMGRVEARMKLPRGIGLWPAFWMLGSNISQYSGAAGTNFVGWPRCGEIDIMESNGINDDALYPRGQPFYSTVPGDDRSWANTVGNRYGVCIHAGEAYDPGYWLRGADYDHASSLATEYNVYGVKWNTEKMIFYFNDTEVCELIWAEQEEREMANQGRPAYTNAFYKDFYIIFNLAICGGYLGWIDKGLVLSMIDDYPYEDRCLMVDWVRVYRWSGEDDEK